MTGCLRVFICRGCGCGGAVRVYRGGLTRVHYMPGWGGAGACGFYAGRQLWRRVLHPDLVLGYVGSGSCCVCERVVRDHATSFPAHVLLHRVTVDIVRDVFTHTTRSALPIAHLCGRNAFRWTSYTKGWWVVRCCRRRRQPARGAPVEIPHMGIRLTPVNVLCVRLPPCARSGVCSCLLLAEPVFHFAPPLTDACTMP